MDTIENTAKSETTTTPQQTPQQTPQHGDRAADLVYDVAADPTRGGIWIYPACYDDFYLCRRRARSLAESFGVPFHVDLFGANGADGEVTPSPAVDIPGYYAFTVDDPRPRLVRVDFARFTQKERKEK